MPAKLMLIALASLLLVSLPPSAHLPKKTLVPQQEMDSTGFSGYEIINPNLLIYPVKQLFEKIELTLMSDNTTRTKYQYTLLDKRFKELVFIINSERTSFLEEAVGRYNSHLGNLMINNKDFAFNYKERISNYTRILKNLQDRYNSISSYRLLIQQAIDTTNRLILYE